LDAGFSYHNFRPSFSKTLQLADKKNSIAITNDFAALFISVFN
jgi:hypothetical protein